MITQNFYPEIGSAGNRMKNIYLLLKEKGYNVDVLTTDPTYPNRNIYDEKQFWNHKELNEDENIYRVKIRNKKYSRNIWNRLFYYLEMATRMVFFVLFSRKKYDVVYVTSPPIFVAMAGFLAKIRYRSRFFLDIRDLWPESLKGVGVFNHSFIIRFFKSIEKFLYKKADHIIVNSKGFVEYISRISPEFSGKLTYLPNGARESEIKPSVLRSKDFKVIYVGNIGLAQDDEVLKNLAKELYKKNIKMTIIGYGIRRESLLKYIKKHRLTNVTFMKPKTREKCFELITSHHVGIVTLAKEDVFETVLPGKVIDYMTCGIPIVASVSGNSKEIIVGRKAGFASQTQDVQELIKYIDKLIADEALYLEMSKNGQAYVKENFLWERNIDSLVKLLG